MAPDTLKEGLIPRHVVRNTISNYLGTFIALGIGVFLTPFILHRMGDADYGLWILVGSVVTYGNLLELGIAGAITKYVAEYRARGEIKHAESLVATALWFYSVLGLIVFLLSALLAPVFSHFFTVAGDRQTTVTQLVLLMGAAAAISLPCTASNAVLRGLQRFDLINLVNTTGILVSAAATIAVLLAGGGLLAMVAVNIPITLALQLPTIWFIHHTVPGFRFGWRGANRALIRPVISFSSSSFMLNIAGHLHTKTDEIVIGSFLPLSAVTPFAIAKRMSEWPRLLTNQFLKVLMPLASELHVAEDQAQLRSLYITGTRLTLAIFLPVGYTVVALAGPILRIWVGPAYAQYAPLVAILTCAALLTTSQWPAGSVLQGMARHRPLAMVGLGSGIANLVLSIALVQGLGLTGVALGTLIPLGIESICFVLPYAGRTIGVGLQEIMRKAFLPALLPVVPMALAFHALLQAVEPVSLSAILVITGIGISVYAIAYLAVGASRVERQTYRTLLLTALRFTGARLRP